MPVLMSPDIAAQFKEKWLSVYPESDQSCSDSLLLDDSLTSLHWLQNFSIVHADPERRGASGAAGCASLLQQQNANRLKHLDPPSSPPAGDTAATGMPRYLGSPVTSVSDCAADARLLNYAQRSGIYGLVPPPPPPPQTSAPTAEVDYKNNPKVKPPYSYASLICMAMQASKQPKVTLSTIYNWITENFCYYKHAEPSWQNSIRHNLSLNKCFIKVPRQKDEPGKGGFWQIDPQYAHMFVNGIFKRRRMSANHYGNNNYSNDNGSADGKRGRDSPYQRLPAGCPYQGGGRRKLHPPAKGGGGGKGARTPTSPLLATEAHCGGVDVLRGDFDLASVFDDVLGGGSCSTFEDLDINTALSALGCHTEPSLQAGRGLSGRWCGEAAATAATATGTDDRQNHHHHPHHHHHQQHHPSSYGYLELSCGANVEVGHVGMTSDLHPPHHHQHLHQQQQHQMLLLPHQQQLEEPSALFPEEVVILPWDEIKEESQVIPLSLDQGFGLCDGFFAEMQPWERVEAYL
ncbi:hypothetical protein NHX12_024658 [Muraenolepis orangiensis]|uniref:Fork-head domain-containing protein n=1 Tax=Muraenolepis orangiensis TaxID=630683 RepID=A0A9Q0ENM9_9TELE|nr:hypothetical protein NHX12_024658 [Muraenolepis orangiensis]